MSNIFLVAVLFIYIIYRAMLVDKDLWDIYYRLHYKSPAVLAAKER